jgi:hypothetical protein
MVYFIVIGCAIINGGQIPEIEAQYDTLDLLAILFCKPLLFQFCLHHLLTSSICGEHERSIESVPCCLMIVAFVSKPMMFFL